LTVLLDNLHNDYVSVAVAQLSVCNSSGS